MTVPEGFVEREGSRLGCYRFLSACFCVPERELLQGGVLDNLVASLRLAHTDAVRAAQEMQEAIGEYTETDLLSEYSRLFLGPFSLVAPPYGSVYLDEGRGVMGESTSDVVRCYARAGLSLDEEQKDMPDHVSVALEFMGVLIYQGLEAFRQTDYEAVLNKLEEQKYFLERHIGAWVPEFAKAIRQGTENAFYRHLGECTETFVKVETLCLDGAVQYLRQSVRNGKAKN